MSNTSKIALFSIWSVILAFGCILFFAAITLFGLHMLGGPLVIASIFLFTLAFISGILAIPIITLYSRSLKNYILACVGVTLSVVPLFFIGAIFYGAKSRLELGKVHVGTYNLQLLGKELKNYAKNNNGRLPIADQWCDTLMKENLKFSETNFRHPQSRKIGLNGECHFAFNKNLSGVRLDDVSGDTVLLFEADGDWNLNGTDELLRTREKNNKYITVVFADGTMADYWYDREAIRKFDKNGKRMYYEQPCWNP